MLIIIKISAMLYFPRHFIPNVSRISISQLKFAFDGKHGGSGAIFFLLQQAISIVNMSLEIFSGSLAIFKN
jgi:hypothetical protein